MIYGLLSAVRARARRQHGVIATMTLFFFVGCGFATLLLLWSIGIITGAFNALYAANQAAAYAAVSATNNQNGGADYSNQLSFQCVYSSANICTGGASYTAANDVMNAELGPSAPGRFNLTYGDNTFLVGPSGQPNQIEAFDITRPAAAAQALAAANGCSFAPGQDGGYTGLAPGDPNPSLNCWRISEFGIDFPIQYSSGVITRSTATLNAIPGCSYSFCTITMNVAAAATENEPAPYSSYDEYYATPPTAAAPAVTSLTVSCVSKNAVADPDSGDPTQSINFIGVSGSSGPGSFKQAFTQQQAIQAITSGIYDFRLSSGASSDVVVSNYNGVQYVKGNNDGLQPSSLLALPGCS